MSTEGSVLEDIQSRSYLDAIQAGPEQLLRRPSTPDTVWKLGRLGQLRITTMPAGQKDNCRLSSKVQSEPAPSPPSGGVDVGAATKVLSQSPCWHSDPALYKSMHQITEDIAGTASVTIRNDVLLVQNKHDQTLTMPSRQGAPLFLAQV